MPRAEARESRHPRMPLGAKAGPPSEALLEAPTQIRSKRRLPGLHSEGIVFLLPEHCFQDVSLHQGWASFSGKGQTVNIVGSAGLCHSSTLPIL